jgi:PadR family transcriptional regulator PadR
MTPDKSDVLYGTLGLLIVKTLEALGPLHGYRIARRIEQISGDQLAMNQGTLYPALLKLEEMGWISSKWGIRERPSREDLRADAHRAQGAPRKKRSGSVRPALLNAS